LEFAVAVKALDEQIEILKHDCFFRCQNANSLKPEDASTHKIITIKRELDQAAQEKMRLNQIKYGNISIGRAFPAIIAQYNQRIY
jgi:hypothetical protein